MSRIKIKKLYAFRLNFFYNNFMKAVYVKEFGGIENLEIREVENPSPPRDKQVLVNVKAAALNRADLLQRRGLYPAPKGFPERILGLEFAGEVFGIGENVVDFKIGDRVFGITAGGAQSEFLLTESSLLAKIPERLDFTQAAAIPEAFITAHDAVFTQGNLQKGETLLIHAVGSGVGLAALQLAKANGIATIGTSRTEDKLLKAHGFGLDFAISTSTDISEDPKHFAELLRAQNQGTGVDVVLDLVGAKYLQANLESLNLNGRLILVGTAGGSKAELNFSLVMAKRLKIIGTVLRSRSIAEKSETTKAFVKDVLPWLESGVIVPNIDRVFKAEEIQPAHEYLESNESFGKVVLEF
jgi:NADPH2:quinone reductase